MLLKDVIHGHNRRSKKQVYLMIIFGIRTAIGMLGCTEVFLFAQYQQGAKVPMMLHVAEKEDIYMSTG